MALADASGENGAAYPVNTWLQDAVQMAADNIAVRIDRTAGNRPWFWVDLKSDPPKLVHDYWDFCDMSGRWTDAMILARLMLGQRDDDTEAILKDFVRGRQGEDGFFYNEPAQSEAIIAIGTVPPGRFADMFCQGRILLTLVTWYLDEGSDELEEQIERFLKALDNAVVWNDGERVSCRVPAVRWLESGSWQGEGGYPSLASGYTATMAPLIMRYWEATGSPVARKIAEGLANAFVVEGGAYQPDGTYTGNTHWAGGCLGPAALTRIARADGNDELLGWCERIFENISSFAVDFGWAPTDINTPEPGKYNGCCEVCSLTDMIHLALQLTDAGAGDHWDFIDTTIRNQMLEQQFRQPARLVSPEQAALSGQPLLAALHGSVESWAPPNTLIGNASGLEGCCTSALVRACYFAWQRAAEDKGGRVWVHLPFSRTSNKLDVLCHEPWHGAMTVKVHQSCNVSVRISKWIDAQAVKVARNGHAVEATISDRYLALDGLSATDTVEITYPLAEAKRSYTINEKDYSAEWRAGTVVELTPPGEPYPIFERKRIDDVPAGPLKLGCADSHVIWHP